MSWQLLSTSLDGSTQSAPSLCIDRRGYPHCAWVNSNGNLSYAFFGGLTWQWLGPSPDTGLAATSVPHLAITLDGEENPHILCVTDTESFAPAVRHTWWDGETWANTGNWWQSLGIVWMASNVDTATITYNPSQNAIYAFRIYQNRIEAVKWNGSTWAVVAFTSPTVTTTYADLTAGINGTSLHLVYRATAANGWVERIIFNLTNNTFGAPSVVADSQGSGQVTALGFLSSKMYPDGASAGSGGIITWVKQVDNACQVHALSFSPSETWGLSGSRLDQYNGESLGDTVAPFYASPSAFLNSSDELRLACAAEGLVLFLEGEGGVFEGARPLPGFAVPRRVAMTPRWNNEYTLATYLSDGNLAVLTRNPNENFSSSSTSESTKSSESTSSSSHKTSASSRSQSSSSTQRSASSSSSSKSSSESTHSGTSSSSTTSSCSWCYTSSGMRSTSTALEPSSITRDYWRFCPNDPTVRPCTTCFNELLNLNVGDHLTGQSAHPDQSLMDCFGVTGGTEFQFSGRTFTSSLYMTYDWAGPTCPIVFSTWDIVRTA